jgi:hypothetical protein
MAISPQLRQFKSSGVYRLEFDKSQTSNINVSMLRVLVGHSKKGPFNTPVLIENVEDFKNVFGDIDKSLEKMGMFFHRSCLAALSRGPLLALNLNDFTAADTADALHPFTNGSSTNDTNTVAENTLSSKPYSDFHNIEKFMTPSDTSMLAISGITGDEDIVSFTNLKTTPITVIIRAAGDIDGFEITADEWYGNGNVPSYLHDKDYLSDFMVDVFVFKGKFDHTVLKNDATYGNYFDDDGLIKSQLDAFSNLRTVTTLAKYSGSLLPGFKDMEGRSLYIESMINAEARRTGLFCAVDEDRVLSGTGTKLDLIGHGHPAGNVNNAVLSYPSQVRYSNSQGDIVEDSQTITGNTFTIKFDKGAGSTTATPNAGSIAWPTTFLKKGDYLHADETNRLAKVLQVSYVDGTGTTQNIRTYTIKTNVAIDAAFYDLAASSTTTSITAVAQVDTLTLTGTSGTATITTAGVNGSPLTATFDTDLTTTSENFVTANASAYADAGITLTSSTTTIVFTAAVAGTAFTSPTIANATADLAGTVANTTVNVVASTDTSVLNSVPYIKPFENLATSYVPFFINGATINLPTITELVNQLSGTGLANALKDKDLIDFRYLVDTFGSYDTNGILTKSAITKLAKDRQNASAIMNAPTIADFRNSTDPKFVDSDGKFGTKYIKDGGNLDLNPTKLYTLPAIADGANHAFYYAPGLLVADSGKTIIVPPAAYVSNNYIDKYQAALPWSIVAGPRRGVVGGSGVVGAEYTFDKADRDILEPFGINPIVFQRGVGLTILGNKTAQQSIKSALSSAHVREVLIYIQDGIADILKDYVFEFNTVQTRLEIKTLVDSFLESVKQDKGVYDFKNIMDSTNNDNEVIDNNMGIVDTYVEPVKGLEIVVHRTTVLNTGEIATGSFL